MIIAASGCSWKTLGASRRDDPCVGKEVAIAIEKQTDDEINLRLKFSEVAQGCTDAMVRRNALTKEVNGNSRQVGSDGDEAVMAPL